MWNDNRLQLKNETPLKKEKCNRCSVAFSNHYFNTEDTDLSTGSSTLQWNNYYKFLLFITVSFLASFVLSCTTYSTGLAANYEHPRVVLTSAVNSDELSHPTKNFLIVNNLLEEYEKNPMVVILDLDTELRVKKERSLALYLSELCYAAAKKIDLDDSVYTKFYGSALIYSYSFLFDKNLGAEPDPYSLFFRTGIDLYNRSLAALIRHAHYTKKLARPGDLSFPVMRGRVVIDSLDSDMTWMPETFIHILVAYDYKAAGFRSHQSGYGMGTPLILIRRFPEKEDVTEKDRFEFFAGMDQAYPATAFFTLEESYLTGDKLEIKAKAHLFDPLRRSRIKTDHIDVPLEIDLSTPLAYMLSKSEKESVYVGRVYGEGGVEKEGLYMIHPYDKNKIPVVFLHGLVSSPYIWFAMINDLLGDKEIRERYQFWVYWYPTAPPIFISSAQFRERLYRLSRAFETHNHPSFQNMVLIGHSMGGLISKTTAQRSYPDAWFRAYDLPHDRISKIPEDEMKHIERWFHYEPVPFVRRLVFIATPHRGSPLAEGLIGKIARTIVTPPKLIFRQMQSVYHFFAGDKNETNIMFEEDSIDSLRKKSGFMKVTNETPVDKNVKYHSIIGKSRTFSLDWITDSVVPFDSSHIPGAESEIIIESNHSVMDHIPTMMEVKRILMIHKTQTMNN